jgi:hypothetical protein
MNQAEMIDRYLQGAEVMSRAVRNVSPAIIDKVPAPNKWSIRQYLVHVFEVELVNSIRIRQMAAHPSSNLLGLDQERWAAVLHYDKQSIEDVLVGLRGLQRVNANLLRALPASAWEQTGIHPKRGVITLATLLERATLHCEGHARKIEELREQFGAVATA